VADMAGTQQTYRSANEYFESLFRRYHRQILAYCIRRLPPDDAEDAAAEVFAVAWRKLDQVPPGESALAWLYAVAHRVLSNQWRSGRRRRQLVERLGGLRQARPETPDTQAVRSDEHQMLVDALGRLRWSDQEILRLATWEKLPYSAIGELLGIREAAVGQRIFRARKLLAAELRQMEKNRRQHVPPPDTKEG